MGKEWCEHITYEYGSYYINFVTVFSDWDICPVKGCHAPRPKEQRKLSAEDLKAVIDIVDNMEHPHKTIYGDSLIKELRERLG